MTRLFRTFSSISNTRVGYWRGGTADLQMQVYVYVAGVGVKAAPRFWVS